MRILKILFLHVVFNILFLPDHVEIAYCSNIVEINHDIPHIVAIDIGHSKSKYGATSSRGIGEYWFNKSIGVMLQEKLNKTRITKAVLINNDGQRLSLSQRVAKINSSHANILVSIHHDSVQQKYLKKWTYENRNLNYCDLFSGHSIFVSRKNVYFNNSYRIAKIIGNFFLEHEIRPTLHHAEAIQGESRELLSQQLGIYDADFLVLSKSQMPAVLIECGIILNREDEQKLKDNEYQNKITDILCDSIVKFIKTKK
jgi:N-acetylmuramoyl-L-alanine amidase